MHSRNIKHDSSLERHCDDVFTILSATPCEFLPGAPSGRELSWRPACSSSTAPTSTCSASASRICTARRRWPKIQAEPEALAAELGLECDFRQTNHEGVLVDWIQEAFEKDAAVIINPAGFSFRSIPVLDALKLISKPVIEVHITNIHRRDELYRHSLVSLAATGVICGLGAGGYLLAVRAVADALAHERR